MCLWLDITCLLLFFSCRFMSARINAGSSPIRPWPFPHRQKGGGDVMGWMGWDGMGTSGTCTKTTSRGGPRLSARSAVGAACAVWLYGGAVPSE